MIKGNVGNRKSADIGLSGYNIYKQIVIKPSSTLHLQLPATAAYWARISQEFSLITPALTSTWCTYHLNSLRLAYIDQSEVISDLVEISSRYSCAHGVAHTSAARKTESPKVSHFPRPTHCISCFCSGSVRTPTRTSPGRAMIALQISRKTFRTLAGLAPAPLTYLQNALYFSFVASLIIPRIWIALNSVTLRAPQSWFAAPPATVPPISWALVLQIHTL